MARDHYPALYGLLMRTRGTAEETKDKIKDYWASPRPHQVNENIKNFTEANGTNSYPSGHATKCYTLAIVLGMLLPEKKSQFLAKAKEMSQIRVLVGEHFPSDTKAGQKLADIIVEKLLTNSEFQKDFKLAKKELREHPADN